MDRARSETVKVGIGLGLVFAFGFGLLGLHLVHAFGEGESLWTFLYGILIPLALAVGLLAGGAWLWTEGTDGDAVLRVAGWTLLGGNALALTAGLTILYQDSEGVVMSDRLFAVAGQASVGAVVGFVVGVYDVRQREAKRRAQSLSNQLTVLNRVLRHDIRNGATVIQGRIDLLADRLEDEDHLDRIRRRAQKLVELGDHARAIEGVLRQESVPRRTVDLEPVIESHCGDLKEANSNLSVDIACGTDLTVSAHPLIESAIENVLDNAVEHNDAATPQLRVECTIDRSDGTEYVTLRIADNGPGIEDQQIAVLEQGYETPLAHARGLGLWLVNWIVTKSGGRLWFDTDEAAGTTVFVRLEQAAEAGEGATVDGATA
jgi:signal transduction histidine kinase